MKEIFFKKLYPYRFFFIIISFLFVLSCSVQYIIEQKDGVRVIKENTAWIKMDDIEYSISRTYWSGEPNALNNYYQVYYLQIRNRSEKSINISSIDFVVLDEDNVQYDVISIEQIIQVVDLFPKNKSSLYEIRRLEDVQEENENILEGKTNLIANSFKFGSLRANTTQKGYIFFNKFSRKQNSFIVKILDKDIVFKIEER